MNKEDTGIRKACFVLVTISAMLILPVDVAVALDIHNITITVTEYRFGGVPDSDPYEFSCGVTGDDITAVTVETPGGVVYDLEAWTTAQYSWGFSQDDLTAAELAASFPADDHYLFTFNGGADFVTLHHDPEVPGGFATITYPVNNSINVPLNPEFTWKDCSDYGDALSRAVAEEEGDMVDFVWLGDITDTSWTVGPLRPGILHWLELSVYTGTTPSIEYTDLDGDDFSYNNYFENCSGVYFTTEAAKEFNLKFKDEGDFCFDEENPAVFVPCREEGDLLNVSHLGLCDVWYRIDSMSTDPENFGPFKITGANGDSLVGYYSRFSLDMSNGKYLLEWTFTGGTGRFEGAYGIGETNGLVVSWGPPVPHAEFEFYGTIYVPKNKGKK